MQPYRVEIPPDRCPTGSFSAAAVPHRVLDRLMAAPPESTSRVAEHRVLPAFHTLLGLPMLVVLPGGIPSDRRTTQGPPTALGRRTNQGRGEAEKKYSTAVLVVPAVRAVELVEAEHGQSRADRPRAGAEPPHFGPWSEITQVPMAVGNRFGLTATNLVPTCAQMANTVTLSWHHAHGCGYSLRSHGCAPPQPRRCVVLLAGHGQCRKRLAIFTRTTRTTPRNPG